MSRKEEEKKENRNKVLPPCRVTEQERVLFKKKAGAAGLSLSAYQRKALLDSIIVKPKHIVDNKAVMTLLDIGNSLKYIAPISNNLNQLVRKTHIHDETDIEHMRDILAALDVVKFSEIKNELERFIVGLIDDS